MNTSRRIVEIPDIPAPAFPNERLLHRACRFVILTSSPTRRCPFVDPCTTRTCCHTFCYECVARAIAISAHCPVDRCPLTVQDLGPADPLIRNVRLAFYHALRSCSPRSTARRRARCRMPAQRCWVLAYMPADAAPRPHQGFLQVCRAPVSGGKVYRGYSSQRSSITYARRRDIFASRTQQRNSGAPGFFHRRASICIIRSF